MRTFAVTPWRGLVTSAVLVAFAVTGVGLAGVQAQGAASASVTPRSVLSFTNYATGSGLGDNTVLGVYAIDDTVYVATLGGLSLAPAGGTTFTNYTTANGLGDNVVIGVFVVDDTIYAPTYGGGLSMSGDGGTTFATRTVANSGLGGDYMRWVYAIDDTIYAATNGGLSISTNNGSTFTNYTTTAGLGSNTVRAVSVVDDTIYAATDGGLSMSAVGGTTFTTRDVANSGLGNDVLTGVFVTDDTIYAATYGGGLSISTDGGATFSSKTTADGLGSDYMFGVYVVGATVYAATNTGLSISNDGGRTFTNYTTANGLGSNTVRGVYAYNSRVYAATDGGLAVSNASALPPVFTGASPPTTGTVGAAYPGYTFTASGTTPITFTVASGTLPPGLALATGGLLSGTPTVAGPYTFTVKASNGTNPDAVSPSITITMADVPSPTPEPGSAPSAPTDVVASPADRSASVSWTGPTDAGSYPITYYRAVARPGGQVCLARAPVTSCTVPGLTNGTPYTFTVEALNGAGWGAPSMRSAPVTPSAPPLTRIVLDQGTRTADGRQDRILTAGTTTGIPAGTRLTPYFRYDGQATFSQGKATITVNSDGTFTWTRTVRKNRALTAYLAWQTTESNKVYWPTDR